MRYGFVMPGRGLKVAAVGPRWAWRGVIAWIAMVVAVLAPSSVRAKEPFDLDLALTMLHAAYTGGSPKSSWK